MLGWQREPIRNTEKSSCGAVGPTQTNHDAHVPNTFWGTPSATSAQENSTTPKPERELGGFSLQGPTWAGADRPKGRSNCPSPHGSPDRAKPAPSLKPREPLSGWHFDFDFQKNAPTLVPPERSRLHCICYAFLLASLCPKKVSSSNHTHTQCSHKSRSSSQFVDVVQSPAPVDKWCLPMFAGFHPSQAVQDFDIVHSRSTAPICPTNTFRTFESPAA